MPNPKPKTGHLTKFEQVSDRPLSKKPIGTRYPQEIYEALLKLPEHQNYIREAVEAKLKADGLIE